ncbi:MAG: macro domain-containing protein [Pirellulaceae bacterium]|nr:macro domain-containing protein [Pirellulaceae bacterium]
MYVTVVDGDLVDQDVEAIVNPWNRNIIPWWLLIPQGVSGAIRKRAGKQPFRELGAMGPIPLGCAVQTSAGRLPFRSIIHVAITNILWRSSEWSIRASVRNAIRRVTESGYRSVAMPLIDAGSGGGNPDTAESMILDELIQCDFDGQVVVVRYRKTTPKVQPFRANPQVDSFLQILAYSQRPRGLMEFYS